MPHLFQNGRQNFLLSRNFLLQKLPSPLQLFLKHPRPCLPRKRNPRQKRRPLPLASPLVALESNRQRSLPLRCRFESASLRPSRRFTRLQSPDQSRTCQFFQRVINLRPRNPRPVPDLPPLQLQIRLIPVHRPLRQQTQQHQIRRSQPQFLFQATPFFLFPSGSLRSLRLCVQYLPHFFPVFLFLLQYHHWHCSAGSRGFFACATAAQNTSSTQGSCRWPLRRFSRSYIRRGFCRASCATL